MRINYFKSREELCLYFIGQARQSLGFYGLSDNGDFYKTTEARWSEDQMEYLYPDWAILFNVMRDDRIEFKDTIHKLSCGV
jgi:hypothetical protein